jgi:hypothetical protein
MGAWIISGAVRIRNEFAGSVYPMKKVRAHGDNTVSGIGWPSHPAHRSGTGKDGIVRLIDGSKPNLSLSPFFPR